MTEGVHEDRIEAGGLSFAALRCGDTGPLALCLHGFPDSARTYRYLLPQLAGAGFRAVAVWTRGYAPTGPAPDASYHLGALVHDADALHEACDGDGDAVLIGHDWGAMTAYGAAVFAPQRWRRLVTMAVPPSSQAATSFLRYEQLRRSFYVMLFQTPLAELVVSAQDMDFLARLWADWSPGYNATEDLAGVRAALATPECQAAAIGYYRAMFGAPALPAAYAEAQAATTRVAPQPTLYLHGTRDGAFGVEGVIGTEEYLSPDSRVELIEDTGHFLHLEQPELVGRLVLEWLSA